MSVHVLVRDFSPGERDLWAAGLNAALPGETVTFWPAETDRATIDYIIAWGHEPGELALFPNLKAVLSLGAGVETLLGDGTIPAGVSIIRLIDPALAQAMAEFVLARVLHYHRDMHLYGQQQEARQWRQLPYRQAQDITVGILGLGQLGRETARLLTGHGYNVIGWSRSGRAIEDIDIRTGNNGLKDLLAAAGILVCLLPLTPETSGILSKNAFAQLPENACLINVGRGGHLVEADLIEALDSGALVHATLDVFGTEPLFEDHTFWRRRDIDITPHISALTLADAAPRIVAQNILRHRVGDVPEGTVDRQRGY